MVQPRTATFLVLLATLVVAGLLLWKHARVAPALDTPARSAAAPAVTGLADSESAVSGRIPSGGATTETLGDRDSAQAAHAEEAHDWDLAVEVVDEAQQPVAGLLVQLEGPEDPVERETDARGRAAFPHAGTELARAPAGRLQVVADVLVPERPRVTVDREPSGDEPVRLVVPRFGALEALVLEADGTPVADDTSVELRVVPPGEACRPPRATRPACAATSSCAEAVPRASCGCSSTTSGGRRSP